MNRQEFIERIAPGAIATYKKYGVFPSLTIAQAILESGWGESVKGNALFGIKWYEGCGYDYQTFRTWEHIDGQDISMDDRFRKYDSWEQSIEDHGLFFVVNPRYKPVLEAKNYIDACYQISKCGYATDPSYTQQLISIIEGYNLMNYDVIWYSYTEILNKVSNNPDEWLKAITDINNREDLGDIEVVKFLPALIEKIYNEVKRGNI